MTAPDLTGVEQLPQPDPRGWLALRYLPDDLQKAEDATADNDRAQMRPRGFTRVATQAERILLTHLGYGPLPEQLATKVTWPSHSVRCRRFPQLEES